MKENLYIMLSVIDKVNACEISTILETTKKKAIKKYFALNGKVKDEKVIALSSEDYSHLIDLILSLQKNDVPLYVIDNVLGDLFGASHTGHSIFSLLVDWEQDIHDRLSAVYPDKTMPFRSIVEIYKQKA